MPSFFWSSCQDELQTTTKNYESQLSMMSEHLCSMNEKLTTQKDEIDALKLSVKVRWGDGEGGGGGGEEEGEYR